MRIVCHYCSQMYDDKHEVCPHCGGLKSHAMNPWDTNRWSAEIYDLLAQFSMVSGLWEGVVITGMYTERNLCLPECFYAKPKAHELLAEILNDWAARMHLSYKPRVFPANDLSIQSGMWLTGPSLKMFYSAYKLMKPLVWRHLLMEMNMANLRFDKIAVEDVTHSMWDIAPMVAYIYEENDELARLIKKVFEYANKESSGERFNFKTSVHHINSFQGDKKIREVTCGELCLYGGMSMDDCLKYGSGFIKGETYEYEEILELGNTPYLRNQIGLKYPLLNGTTIINKAITEIVEYEKKSIQLDTSAGLLCSDTAPLAFICDFKRLGFKDRLASLFGAASMME